MDKVRAFDVLKRLSFERVSATPKELEAAHLLVDECAKMGLEAVIEPFEVPFPEVSEVKFLADGKEVYCTGHGYSGQTDDGGVTGPLCYIHGGQDEYLTDVKGKIVVTHGGMSRELRKKLVEKGAVGYVVCWGGIYDDEIMISQVPHRNANLEKDDTSNFPGVMMNLYTAEQLVHSHPESCTIILKQDTTTSRESRNVVATIEGSEKPEEIVVFSAHYDSVEFSSGAWDNATGSVTLLELAHHYMENKPKRTVKFVWCGSEEVGLNGSLAFCKQHQDINKNIIMDINFDMTGVLFGDDSIFGACDPKVVDRALYLGKTMGKALKSHGIGMPSTDLTSFAMNGIPGVTFGSGGVRNGAVIHSRRDVLDRLDADRFIELCEFVAVYADEIVNAVINPVPRELPKEVTDQKDRWVKALGLVRLEEKKD